MLQPPTQLDSQNHEIPRHVYDNIMSNADKSKPYLSEQIWYKSPERVTLVINQILDNTHDLLSRHGYPCLRDRWFLETHRYYSNNNEKEVISPLAWHQDDGGGWPESKVVTCLYYLRRDTGLIGGNLQYTLDSEDPDPYEPSLLNLFSSLMGKGRARLEVPDKHPKILIKTGMTVMMRGDMWHRPENIKGVGERELLVIQFPRLSN